MGQQREAHARELEAIANEYGRGRVQDVASAMVFGTAAGVLATAAMIADDTSYKLICGGLSGSSATATAVSIAQRAINYFKENSLRVQARLVRKGYQSIPEPQDNYNLKA